ncbi:MAG: isochorismatase family protein [Actinomycetota bacterium]
METKPDATALIVVDVQVGVMVEALERDAVIANIAALVDRARATDTPVVWVLHDDEELVRDSDAWQLVPELSIADGEPVIHKQVRDSFGGTDLDPVLRELGVGHLVVTGAQTDFCVVNTLHGSVARGYGATLVSDAHTTEDLTRWGGAPPEDVIAHTNMTWGSNAVPGLEIGTATTAEVAFSG